MLRSFVATFGLAVGAACLTAAHAQSPAPSPEQVKAPSFKVVKIQPNDGLNVRSGPSTRYGVIGVFHHDTRGIAFTGACQGMWCPVQHETLKGWAFRGYLDKDETVAVAAKPVTTAAIPPEAAVAKPAEPDVKKAEPAAPKSLPEAAFRYFVSQGWSEHQAAGIVGNLQAECGPALNCSIHSGGIAQWRAERVTRFRNVFGYPFAKASFKDQLAYIQWELTHPNSPWKDSGRILKRAGDAASAAALFDIHYERSSGEARGARIANARTILRRFGGKAAS
ncbi:MAG: SH3 domain-containing protein [Hyphomicrobiales bacterium]|nr:MAG: SH3 domain-containing protein [Hyphomicrobiales bacterium]